MFRFKEITLNGWDLWPAVRIPLDRDVILVTGPNGSGKTTLLDAIRQLLHAPKLSSKRKLQHYLRNPRQPALVAAVVSNEQTEKIPPPFARSRITTPEVTLACALVPASGGSPEKRFAILPGRKTVQELQTHLLRSRNWIGPDEYRRALESAGVTRSLLKVLAIEQGRTNEMFNLKPKELFRQVIDMMGRREVLDRYREARRTYDESEAEVSRQTAELQRLQTNLNTVDRKVRDLDDWEDLRSRVEALEQKVPAALYQQDFAKNRQDESELPKARKQLVSHEAERERQRIELETREKKKEMAADLLERARTEEYTADRAGKEALHEHSTYAERFRALEAKKKEVDAIPVGDLDELESGAEEARRTAIEAEIEADRLQGDLRKLQQDLEILESGLPAYPHSVRSARQALVEAGIKHALACELMELSDNAVASTIEAVLDDVRFALIVSGKDAEPAIDLARQHDFPGPIYCGDRLEAPVSVGSLDLLEGAPAWIPEHLDAVSINERGCWTDQRGTWVKAADQRFIGAAARKAEIERIGKECKRLERAAKKATERASDAGHRSREIADRLSEERLRQQLLVETSALLEIREKLSASKRFLDDCQERLEKAKSKCTIADKELRDIEFQIHSFQSKVARTNSFLESDKKIIADLELRIQAARATLADLESKIPRDLRAAAELGKLDGPDTVRTDLERAHGKLADAGEPPPSEVREEAKNLRANIEELERHLDRRRNEAQSARTELDECRSRYLDIVEAALRDYRERVKNLALRADVGVEMELPRLENEDRSLDEAEISVRMGFDAKERLPLGDPSFSGGQQVVAGMILLMAMAETGGQGFFILDEPFAHLSLDRVDDVGRFLKAARAQFILTAPTTLDREQLDPASLVIVLQKRKKQDQHAPVPIVAVA